MGPRFLSVFLLFSLPAAFAQSSFNGRCQVTSTPIQVRYEGLTERFGDIVLVCSGAAPGTMLTGNVTLYFPVAITNRIDANSQTRDAVLSVDTGSGFAPSSIAGLVAQNSISFNGLSFAAPTGSINLKVSGVRGAVSNLGKIPQTQVVASISSPLLVNQASVIVGYTAGGLTATLYSTGITCYGSPAPATSPFALSDLLAAGTAFASTRLTEGFASAFETRQAGTDNGVRFLVKYSGFPANSHLYIPDAVAGSDALVPTAGGDLDAPPAVGQYVPGSNTLVVVRVNGTDATGSGGYAVFPPQGSGPQLLNSVSEVPLTNGSGYAVYEVADANPSVMESAQFPTFFVIPNVTSPAIASESVSLAPVSVAPVGATASATAPIVRFIANNPPTDCTALADCNAKYFPKLFVDASSIQIGAIANSKTMTTQPGYIPIRNASGGLLAWSVILSYQTGSGWLFVDYSSGLGNGSVRVWSDATNLGAGTYQATVTINAGSAGSQTIPLTLTVAPAPPPPPPPPPAVTVSQVLNAATLTQTPLVAGSLATIMGSHLSGKSVSVTFDGAAATLLYTSDTQINLQVPLSLSGKTQSSLVVTADGSSSTPVMVTLAPAWPAIFANGVLNGDNSVNGPGAPTKAGDVLQIFATGIPSGVTVSAQIGGQDSNLRYAGDAPGLLGVQQVNVAVPDGASGAASLILCATPPGGQAYCSTGYQLVLR